MKMPKELLTRTIGVWFALAVTMTANGIFREWILRDVFGSAADNMSVALGGIIILAVTQVGFGNLVYHETSELLVPAFVLTLLTLCFEFSVGRAIDHKSWTELFENYAIWRGHLWPILLGLVAISPFIWIRPSPGLSTDPPQR